ncbi:MAG TPA: sigma-70 family RNA polymerase sigma factor [Solirubrobacteraceae bacterium]|jgi:RNA polymerase sigma factor (sigma-70 family)|nr:sigma-70 family RNA polymerase sigma factor [Solirubrobacteraceae bacterium]
MEAGALRAPAGLNRISVTAPLLRLRSDEQLVALFRAGNDAAFSVIHDRYRQRLFAYARQMLDGSRQDAEDALQDVFLRAYSSLRANDRPLSLRAWLYRVAHNRCVDHLRKPVPPAIDLFDTSRKPLHDPIAEAERRDDLRRLIEDVRRLPDQQRSALLMREIDGLSYAELGAALGVSLPAVKSLLVRARISLVEAVEARDTDCLAIRGDLADAYERGVRASGLARRHLRDCPGCVEYRTQLRAVRQGFSALAPGGSGPMAAFLKLVGIGGAGSAGAASAGGGAAAGGGAIAAVGTGTAAKVAAVVCCAALTAGGAVEVGSRLEPSHRAPARPAHAAPVVQRSVATPVRSATRAATALPKRAARRGPVAHIRGAVGSAVATKGLHDAAVTGTPADDPSAGALTDDTTGGATAPNEDTGFGHGVDGLTPVTAGRDGSAPDLSSTSPTATPTANGSGGFAAPPSADSSPVAAPVPAAAGKAEFVPGSPSAG